MSRTPSPKETSFKDSYSSHCSLFLAGLLFLTLFPSPPLLAFSLVPCQTRPDSAAPESLLRQPPPPGCPVPLFPPEQHSPCRYHLLLSLVGPGLALGVHLPRWQVYGADFIRTTSQIQCCPEANSRPLGPAFKTFHDLSQALFSPKLPLLLSESL